MPFIYLFSYLFFCFCPHAAFLAPGSQSPRAPCGRLKAKLNIQSVISRPAEAAGSARSQRVALAPQEATGSCLHSLTPSHLLLPPRANNTSETHAKKKKNKRCLPGLAKLLVRRAGMVAEPALAAPSLCGAEDECGMRGMLLVRNLLYLLSSPL